MNPKIAEVTQRIIERSKETRKAYLDKIEHARRQGPHRGVLSCGNLAHGFAACGTSDKADLRSMTKANVAIISSYNDMLSAHQPYETYPAIIKDAIKEVGSVAQFAGGVPAMCDGVTQGQSGMDLSLMSRDNIAQGAAIALSHNMFDSALSLAFVTRLCPDYLWVH
jgi:phosphogluconate dehydratase